MTELDDSTRTYVARLADIIARKADLEDEEKAIKSHLRSVLQIGDRGTIDGRPVIALQPNRRFSSTLAEKTLPAALLELCTVTKVDSGAAKKNLPPSVYEGLMETVGEPKVALLS